MKQNLKLSFKNKKVLLIGDVILDVYIYSNIVNEALYAPIPEVEEKRTQVSFGGNGLVASHILELGGKVFFVSVIGNDEEAKHYHKWNHKSLKKFFFVDDTRKTTVKKRWFAGGEALLQANQVDNHAINSSLEKKIINRIKSIIPIVDVVTVMDPQHGLLTKNIINNILKLCKKYNKPFYIDTQISHRPSNHHLYKGAHTMFLNKKEAKAVFPEFNLRKPEQALKKIRSGLHLQNVLIKLSENGFVGLFDNKFLKSSGYKVKTVDACGAGDAFLAAFSLGDKNNLEETLKVANIWAALSTTIHGTIPPKKKNLLKALSKE
jgi:D-glycero-beta-D-manno-heptose-7-phosphate kinase